MKTLVKTDMAGILGSARDLVGKVISQADDGGEIDRSILDQLKATLDVAGDSASDASVPSGSTGTTESSTTPPSSTTPSESSSTPSSTASDGITDKSTVTSTDLGKVAEPLDTRPPMNSFNLQFDHTDELAAKLPAFTQALMGNDLHKAEEIAGRSSIAFDTMFNMAQKYIVKTGGWSEKLMAEISGNPGMMKVDRETGLRELRKAATNGFQASSVPGINLLQLAKLMLPVYAGFTLRIPSDSPHTMSGESAIWRAMLGFGTLAFHNYFGQAEAATGNQPPTNFLTFTAPYDNIATKDSITLKSIMTSQGYADPYQLSVIESVAATIQGQENVNLGGNIDAVAAPTIATSASGTGGSLASGSPIYKVTSLTFQGTLDGGSTGSGTGYTPYGESAASASGLVTVTASSGAVTLTWPIVPGAFAYNVYVSTDNNASHAYYNQTVYVNKAVITTASVAGSGSRVPPSADTTPVTATGAINGALYWASASSVYGNVIDNKLGPYDNAAGALTAGGLGVSQVNQVMAEQWTKWKIYPSLAIMSANMALKISKIYGSLSNSPVFVINADMNQGKLTGGAMMGDVVNSFAKMADGSGKRMEIMAHPSMPDGTIAFFCESIPYPNANETRGFVRDVLFPYTYFPLPSVDYTTGLPSVQYNYNISTSETMECFLPGPQAIYAGIDVNL